MKKQYLKTFPGFLILGIFLIFSDFSYCQQLNKIYEDIGGGSGDTNTSVDSNVDYTLYIVGGLLVAGIVAYALLRDNKEKPTKDTTVSVLNDEFLAQNLSFNEKIANLQSQIPINISFGMHRDKALRR